MKASRKNPNTRFRVRQRINHWKLIIHILRSILPVLYTRPHDEYKSSSKYLSWPFTNALSLFSQEVVLRGRLLTEQQRGERALRKLGSVWSLLMKKVAKRGLKYWITPPMYNYGMPACWRQWWSKNASDKNFTLNLGTNGHFPLSFVSGKTLYCWLIWWIWPYECLVAGADVNTQWII